jgi:dTDP-4-amino-4,6-dideoxygalactose transaminase
LAALYDELLADLLPVTSRDSDFGMRVYYPYTICASRRSDLTEHSAPHGIGAQTNCSVPVPLEPAHAFFGGKEHDIPATTHQAEEYPGLPMFRELSKGEVRPGSAAIQGSFDG